jgi:hypothetical protein
MKKYALLITNAGLFILSALLLAAGQTSFWLQLFGSFPAPALWMPVLVYLALFRSTITLVVLSHLLSIGLASATTMPEPLLMISCLAVGLSVQTFKTRIYWSATTYFMMISGIATLVFHIFYFISTWLLDSHPITSPSFSAWIIQALLTPLFAPLFFPFFRWIDAITEHTEPPEISGAYHA